MKTEIEQLIDRLGGNEHLPCNCYCCESGGVCYPEDKVPVLIGDVLQKMLENYEDGIEGFFSRDGWGLDVGNYSVAKILRFWGSIGLTKSLQEIYAEAEWEEVCFTCVSEVANNPLCAGYAHDIRVVPKQPAIRELFEFLLSLHL